MTRKTDGIALIETKRPKHASAKREGAGLEITKFTDDVEILTGFIQGQPAESVEEERVARALAMLGFAFEYQVGIFGAYELPGSQRIDFLVYTVPWPTPLWVQGEHWHGGATSRQSDQFKQAQVRHRMGGHWQDPKEIWDYEATTVRQAYSNLFALLGRG